MDNADPTGPPQHVQGGMGLQPLAPSVQAIRGMVRGNLTSALQNDYENVEQLFWTVEMATMYQLQDLVPQQDVDRLTVIVRNEVHAMEAQHVQTNYQNRASIIRLVITTVQAQIASHPPETIIPVDGLDGDVDRYVGMIETGAANDLLCLIRPDLQSQLRDILRQHLIALRGWVVSQLHDQRQNQRQLCPQTQGPFAVASTAPQGPLIGANASANGTTNMGENRGASVGKYSQDRIRALCEPASYHDKNIPTDISFYLSSHPQQCSPAPRSNALSRPCQRSQLSWSGPYVL